MSSSSSSGLPANTIRHARKLLATTCAHRQAQWPQVCGAVCEGWMARCSTRKLAMLLAEQWMPMTHGSRHYTVMGSSMVILNMSLFLFLWALWLRHPRATQPWQVGKYVDLNRVLTCIRGSISPFFVITLPWPFFVSFASWNKYIPMSSCLHILRYISVIRFFASWFISNWSTNCLWVLPPTENK